MIPYSEPPRYCLACEKMLLGRRDKKFCNNYCRNDYNNYIRGKRNHIVKKINRSLERNRHILQHLLAEGAVTATATRETMLRLGFEFRYYTHTYTTRKNEKTYFYCYDYGYLPLENSRYLIVPEK